MTFVKRASPEDSDASPGPLFSARARATDGMTRASVHAERVEPGWRDNALAVLYQHCREHPVFLCEDVPLSIPRDADPRAAGALMQEARRRGWISADGWAPSASSNGSAKVRWRSLILTPIPVCKQEISK